MGAAGSAPVSHVELRPRGFQPSRRLLVLPKLLVVAADEFGKLGRHRIAVNRHQRILGLAFRKFFRHAIPHLGQRFGNLGLHQRPLRSLALALELRAHAAGPLAHLGQLISQIGFFNHLLDVAEALRPLLVVGPGEWTRRFVIGRTVGLVEEIAAAPLLPSACAPLGVGGFSTLVAHAAPRLTRLLILAGRAFRIGGAGLSRLLRCSWLWVLWIVCVLRIALAASVPCLGILILLVLLIGLRLLALSALTLRILRLLL